MIKFLVLVILVVAGTLSYDTEIRASLLNWVGIVKTVVDDVADNLCNEGDQCRRNNTLPIPFIDDMNTNPSDEFPELNIPDDKKNELYDPYLDIWPEDRNNNNSKVPKHSSPPSVTPAPEAVPDNKKMPWSDFIKQYGN